MCMAREEGALQAYQYQQDDICSLQFGCHSYLFSAYHLVICEDLEQQSNHAIQLFR